MQNWEFEGKKKKKKPDPYFQIFWVGRKRANKHLFFFLRSKVKIFQQKKPCVHFALATVVRHDSGPLHEPPPGVKKKKKKISWHVTNFESNYSNNSKKSIGSIMWPALIKGAKSDSFLWWVQIKNLKSTSLKLKKK